MSECVSEKRTSYLQQQADNADKTLHCLELGTFLCCRYSEICEEGGPREFRGAVFRGRAITPSYAKFGRCVEMT